MLDLLKKIPTSKATGCDALSVKVLKLAATVLASPFCRLMNLFISTGSFPSTWKTAQVTPLFKNRLSWRYRKVPTNFRFTCFVQGT